MRAEEKVTAYAVQANTLEELNTKIKKELEGKENPIVEPMPAWGFCVWIKYTVTVSVPEDELEAMNLKHGHFHCRDCNALMFSDDKRMRNHQCARHGFRRHEEQLACMEFYSDLERGFYDKGRMEKES